VALFSGRVVIELDALETDRTRLLEYGPDGPVQGRLVPLERQQVVALALSNQPRVLGLIPTFTDSLC
jgi:hypothetical protein